MCTARHGGAGHWHSTAIIYGCVDVAGFSAADCIGLLVASLQSSIPQLQQNLSRPQLQVPRKLVCASAASTCLCIGEQPLFMSCSLLSITAASRALMKRSHCISVQIVRFWVAQLSKVSPVFPAAAAHHWKGIAALAGLMLEHR
jgi:hypothetical protein